MCAWEAGSHPACASTGAQHRPFVIAAVGRWRCPWPGTGLWTGSCFLRTKSPQAPAAEEEGHKLGALLEQEKCQCCFCGFGDKRRGLASQLPCSPLPVILFLFVPMMECFLCSTSLFPFLICDTEGTAQPLKAGHSCVTLN